MPLRQAQPRRRSEEHTSELQSHSDLVCRLLLEKKKYDDCAARDHQLHKPGLQWGAVHDAAWTSDVVCCGADGDDGFRFFFNDTATTEIYTLSLHDALPI